MSEPGLIGRIQSSGERLETALFSWSLPRRWWLNLILFLVTLVTTTIFGSALVADFRAGRALSLDSVTMSYVRFAHGDSAFWTGLNFSAPLLLILLSHELGHYLASRLWGVDASLPYFLPSPTLFGTLGAFIRIRSPIYRREGLFDIGVAGPLAGFIVLLPFLIAGVWMSHLVPNPAAYKPLVFGTPAALRFFEWLRFPGVQPSRILLHPTAMAAWTGLLATAMNLLPIGQLDGGHIIYAAFGQRWHRVVSTSAIALLGLLGFLYWLWWFWAVLMFFIGRRHPLVYDPSPLSRSRWALCSAALIVLLVSATVVPVRAF